MAIQPVPLGNLNRLKANVTYTAYPQLNLTSPYLGKEGIRLTLEGVANDLLPAMVGAVQSPVPYQLGTMTISVVKTTNLYNLYKAQFESDTNLGDTNVYPDAANIPPFQLVNCVLESVQEMAFDGTAPSIMMSVKGIYYINNFYFQ